MQAFQSLLEIPAFPLFVIIGVGLWVGAFRARGISLGAGGVLFAGMLYGHLFQHALPKPLTDLGLLLFVYAVGLQAGPRFFGLLRARGKQFLLVGFLSCMIGALAAVAVALAFGLSPALAAGLYSGATTCTPALASALDLVATHAPGQEYAASVGYGMAYPFSVLFVVVLVQLLPALCQTQPEDAAREAREDEARRDPPMGNRDVRVTNPNCDGMTVEQLSSLRVARAVISRVKHDGEAVAALPGTTVRLHDVVRVVGTPDELAKAVAMLGTVVDEPMGDRSGDLAAVDVVVSRESVAGKTIRELAVYERAGAVITRIRREGLEFSPSASFALERGDAVRVVGSRAAVDAFVDLVGRQERSLEETSLVPLAIGIAIGVAVGLVPIPLPGGLEARLGMAGGAFVVALLLGHAGRIGPIALYVPNAAKLLLRELGLVVFLAGVGSGAGVAFASVLQEAGPRLLLAGAIVTVVTSMSALVLMRVVLRWNVLTAAGALSATMTNPPALRAATGLVDSEAQAAGFASVYPVALISKVLLAQAVFLAVSALSR